MDRSGALHYEESQTVRLDAQFKAEEIGEMGRARAVP